MAKESQRARANNQSLRPKPGSGPALGLGGTDPVWQAETPGGSLTDPKARYDWPHADHLGTPILQRQKKDKSAGRPLQRALAQRKSLSRT